MLHCKSKVLARLTGSVFAVMPLLPFKCMSMSKSSGSQIISIYMLWPPQSLAVDDWTSGGYCDMTMHCLRKYQEHKAFSRGCRNWKIDPSFHTQAWGHLPIILKAWLSPASTPSTPPERWRSCMEAGHSSTSLKGQNIHLHPHLREGPLLLPHFLRRKE